MTSIFARAALGWVGLLGVAACGGSSSESPWPVEPEHAELGPAGEKAPIGTPMEEKTPESRGEVSPDRPRPTEAPDAGPPAKKKP